jgi:putative FmdB family regulatory protein
MPVYEYKCLGCAGEFELLILRASQVPACPACESTSVERRVSMFAVSSESSRQSSRASAFDYNNKLNAKQEPDKARIQIDHPHQH